MFTINIDTGGTFTDGFFTRNEEFKTVKTPTTPHDLTVCLADCIKESARQFGVSLEEMLSDTDVVRYSTTIAVNALITRTGSKIGLIVTEGFKESLYAKEIKETESIYNFMPQEMITAIAEEIDEEGNIKTALKKDEVLEKMQYLIDSGARAIAVSLRNSHLNSTHEKQIKKIIKEQYPGFYLGSVRVFLASEISDQPGDLYRTNAVVINGYIHDSLVKYLYKGEDDLRAKLYQHPLMVSHSHGGVARVAKTRAIDTVFSGPALGIIGAEMMAKIYGIPYVLTADVGGTSLDLGLIGEGAYSYSLIPSISELIINVPMINTHSVALASGSIARLEGSNLLKVGPQSAGARPGPVCFDLGGLEPTVTDADVALGFIDPNYFLGGRVKLNKERAISVISAKIAKPLGISVDEASYLIKQTAERNIREEILMFLEKQGMSPEDDSEIALLAYGGAGPTHCCGFTEDLPFSRILTSPHASVFSAFGASTTDLTHTYPKYFPIALFDGVNYTSDYGRLNPVVKNLIEIARRDIKGEGFSPDKAVYFLDFVGDEDLAGVRIRTDKLFFRSEKDVKDLCAAFNKVGKQQMQKITVSTIILNALVKMPHFELKRASLGGEDSRHAFRGKREVFWSSEAGYITTFLYERELLVPGNLVKGPAIVESKDTTYVIPPERLLRIDEFSNGIIMEA